MTETQSRQADDLLNSIFLYAFVTQTFQKPQNNVLHKAASYTDGKIQIIEHSYEYFTNLLMKCGTSHFTLLSSGQTHCQSLFIH